MPKFEVIVTLSRDLVFEVDAVNEEEAAKIALDKDDLKPVREGEAEQVVKATSRKLDPQELVYKFQIENIRRDYDILSNSQKLPSGEFVDDATAETMKAHLAIMHNNLVDQSGLDIPHLSQGDSLVAEHLGEDVIPAKIDNELARLIDVAPEVIWERCATAFGWEWDADYKGWIKPGNIKEGKRRGEWDAFVRDMTAEDACNEEGIDSVEEAAEALT